MTEIPSRRKRSLTSVLGPWPRLSDSRMSRPYSRSIMSCVGRQVRGKSRMSEHHCKRYIQIPSRWSSTIIFAQFVAVGLLHTEYYTVYCFIVDFISFRTHFIFKFGYILCNGAQSRAPVPGQSASCRLCPQTKWVEPSKNWATTDFSEFSTEAYQSR